MLFRSWALLAAAPGGRWPAGRFGRFRGRPGTPTGGLGLAQGHRRATHAVPRTVVLRDLDGKSYEEAAAAMGCALGTVRSRLFRARELLARKFQGNRERQKCL